MKTYTVYTSQLVYFEKTVQAESAEQAEEIAFESSNNSGNWSDWVEVDYGEWLIEEAREVKE
jgi:hypothetical protein